MRSTISDRLKEAMKKNNMKQIDVIKKANMLKDSDGVKITKTDLSQYVNNKTSPGQKKLYILAKTLNVSEAWLLGYDVQPIRPTDEERTFSRNGEIIAAHISDDVNDKEMKEIINFIEYIKSKRNSDK